jgi:hypothetical protein
MTTRIIVEGHTFPEELEAVQREAAALQKVADRLRGEEPTEVEKESAGEQSEEDEG